MNLIYLCCIEDPWLGVSIELKKRGLFPKLWIGWNENNEKKIITGTHEFCEFIEIENAWKGIFIETFEENYLDKDILTNFSFFEMIGLKMMDRLDVFGSFSYNERVDFYRYLLNYWINYIKKNDIELVISPITPHRVFDYCLFVAAKILKVKFLSFKWTTKYDLLLPVSDIFDFNLLKDEKTSDLDLDIIEMCNKYRLDYDKSIPLDIIDQNKNIKNSIFNKFLNNFSSFKKVKHLFKDSKSYLKEKNVSYIDSNYKNYQIKYLNYKGRRFKENLKNEYLKYSTKPDLDKIKYIYFPLHYQPEETTVPSGGVFYDQILCLKMLCDTLPDDYRILVKEHSTQFHHNFEGERGRSKNFYKHLLNLKNVIIVDLSINSFKLIDKSICVATITGTVGIEAIARSKNVLVFGNAWYKYCEGAHIVNSKKSIKNALNNFNAISDKSVENYFRKLIANGAFRAYHYKDNKIYSIISKKASITNLTKSVLNFLNE